MKAKASRHEDILQKEKDSKKKLLEIAKNIPIPVKSHWNVLDPSSSRKI